MKKLEQTIKGIAAIGFTILVMVFVIGFINGATGNNTSTDASFAHATSLSGAVSPPAVTKAEFMQIENDMTYEQVVAIIGAKGEVQSESNIAGYHTVMYSWMNPGGPNMNAMFQNGKLINKAQFGLQ
jgi:hypothetical protein